MSVLSALTNAISLDDVAFLRKNRQEVSIPFNLETGPESLRLKDKILWRQSGPVIDRKLTPFHAMVLQLNGGVYMSEEAGPNLGKLIAASEAVVSGWQVKLDDEGNPIMDGDGFDYAVDEEGNPVELSIIFRITAGNGHKGKTASVYGMDYVTVNGANNLGCPMKRSEGPTEADSRDLMDYDLLSNIVDIILTIGTMSRTLEEAHPAQLKGLSSIFKLHSEGGYMALSSNAPSIRKAKQEELQGQRMGVKAGTPAAARGAIPVRVDTSNLPATAFDSTTAVGE